MMECEADIIDRLEWAVESDGAGERLDKFITESVEEDVSRSQVQEWIKAGYAVVNERTAKANTRLNAGDRVELKVPAPVETEIVAEPIALDIVYEDRDLIVVNKQRGLVVHPAPGHASGTLVNALLYHCRDLSGINGELRPGIVHRIDKDTSGLLMAAKNDKAHQGLASQLSAHTVSRKYLAVVTGVIAHDQGTIDAPIGRDSADRKQYTVTHKNSKRAVTHFTVLERFREHTFVQLKLETGRTHQIRVHMKYIGHSLIGDPMYGKTKRALMTGQALHAAELGFIHPTDGRELHFEAPLPADMSQLLDILRNQ